MHHQVSATEYMLHYQIARCARGDQLRRLRTVEQSGPDQCIGLLEQIFPNERVSK